MLDKTELRARPKDRLATLTLQIGRIEGELNWPLNDDFAEQAVDREDDQALDALKSSALAKIDLTREAIARLDSGSYGLCASCGNVIAAERLSALPAAAECIHCASTRHNPKL